MCKESNIEMTMKILDRTLTLDTSKYFLLQGKKGKLNVNDSIKLLYYFSKGMRIGYSPYQI
jgi:hypothetical protein